jgi:predicted RNA-binding Zn ribbon-like protein
VARHQFDLSGGHPALDFVNTVRDWTVPGPHEYLGGFGDAVRFGRTAGFLSRAEAAQLRPSSAQAELSRLRGLRRSLQRIFRASVIGRAAEKGDLARLNRTAIEAARASRLVASARAPVTKSIAVEDAGASVLRLRIAEAAVALLLSDAMTRVKACPGCGWFFLDVSKNQSRRWCSMAECGARAKARRYYRKRKNLRI